MALFTPFYREKRSHFYQNLPRSAWCLENSMNLFIRTIEVFQLSKLLRKYIFFLCNSWYMVTLKVPLVGSKETYNNYEVLSLAFLTATMYMNVIFLLLIVFLLFLLFHFCQMCPFSTGFIHICTVDNKKMHPPRFQPFVFPVYLRNRLRYNKSVYIFLHPFLKIFQLEQEFIKSGYKISWYLQKR